MLIGISAGIIVGNQYNSCTDIVQYIVLILWIKGVDTSYAPAMKYKIPSVKGWRDGSEVESTDYCQ